jgi:type I restriction enzyme S subunit
MSDWKKFRLDNLATVIMGLSPSGETYNEDGIGTPLLNGPTEFGETFPHCTVYTTDPKRICKKGDLIFCVRGSTTGRMNWADKPYAIGRGVCSISGNDELSTKFIKHLLSLNLPALLQITGGGTFPNLRKEDINGFEFSTSENYRKIASILSAYDDLIENNLKRIKLLEELAQRTYEEWFVKFRINGEQLPVDEKTGLPVGWEIMPFESLIDFKEGPGLRNSQYREQGIPFLNIRVIKEDEVDFSKVQFLDPHEVETKYPHFLLKENDHVISTSGTLGRLVTIRKRHLPLCLNTSLIRMRQLNDNFGKWLIKHTLSNPKFIDKMESYANGSAQKNFGPIHLKQIKLIAPTRNISLAFEKFIEPIELLKQKLKDQNIELKTSRDILLPRLMNGKIKVE